ncbi:hypothetical protein BCR43DRAFT_483652 [Syncephalastrum racemosum]|uniref:C2H2-type domain-containing protein n=1 Tax=Syncephalastrum racemosum TaxID=13706 RepID=A0A1X2HVN2_SYNRA|nr:hypothetical protein BCR43DRAFT_483652 [Syncephalastrum racemosum]
MLCPPFLEMYSTSSSSAVEAFDAVAPGFIEQLDPCDPCRAILEDPSAASLRAPLSEVLLGTQTGHFPLVDPPLDMTDQSWCRPDYGALFADLPLLAFPSNTPMNPAGRSVSATALGHNSTAFTGGISSRVSTTNDVVGEPITVLSQSRSWLRCSSCMRTFPDYDAIREHEKRHHVDDHKHHCFFCPRGFTRNDVRRRHIKSQHRREAAALFQKRRA